MGAASVLQGCRLRIEIRLGGTVSGALVFFGAPALAFPGHCGGATTCG